MSGACVLQCANLHWLGTDVTRLLSYEVMSEAALEEANREAVESSYDGAGGGNGSDGEGSSDSDARIPSQPIATEHRKSTIRKHQKSMPYPAGRQSIHIQCFWAARNTPKSTKNPGFRPTGNRQKLDYLVIRFNF